MTNRTIVRIEEFGVEINVTKTNVMGIARDETPANATKRAENWKQRNLLTTLEVK